MQRAAAIAALCLLACDPGPRAQDCKVRCSAEGGCPEGLVCSSEGLCRPPAARGLCGCPAGDVAPRHVADDAALFDSAGLDGGVAVVWAEPEPRDGGYAISYRVFDGALAGLIPETRLELAGPGLTSVSAAGDGRRLWLFWQEGGAAGGGARMVDLARPLAPASLPGYPRPEASTALSAVGTPDGLVAAWGVGASTIRIGRWPGEGGGPAMNDLPLPLAGVTRLRQVLLSSGASAVGFEAEVGAELRRGVLEVSGGRAALGAFGSLVDGPSGAGVYWCEAGTSRLKGRLDAFSGAVLDLYTAPSPDAITLCTALATARGPVVAWVERGQLNLGLPGAEGGLLRTRAVDLAGQAPLLLSVVSGGSGSAAAFFRADDVLRDLWATQACLP